ncbi:MAG: hypothetical protein JWQ71_1028 [Pedosphaera sp.]|nr:hypothetical protein [Pedosphaera sp.]
MERVECNNFRLQIQCLLSMHGYLDGDVVGLVTVGIEIYLRRSGFLFGGIDGRKFCVVVKDPIIACQSANYARRIAGSFKRN